MAAAYNVSLDQRYAVPIGNERMGMLTGTFNVASSGSADLTGYFKSLHRVILSNPWPDATNNDVYHGVYSTSSGSLAVYGVTETTSTMGVATVSASSAAVASLSIPFVAFGLL